tara:strand:- start:975 stop:1151 length:177 start_codon:yes stop_codon:yes gene_type:complete
MKDLKELIQEKEKIAYRLRYASRQMWATELLEKEFDDITNKIKNQVQTDNFEAEYYAY